MHFAKLLKPWWQDPEYSSSAVMCHTAAQAAAHTWALF